AVDLLAAVGGVDQGRGLPLLLESLQHRLGIHAGLDELQSDSAFHGLGLLGDPDFAHPTFADLLLERVAAGYDHSGLYVRPIYTRVFGLWWKLSRADTPNFARPGIRRHGQLPWRLVQDVIGLIVRGQQRLDGGPKFGPTGTRFLKERGTFFGRPGQRFLKQGFFGHGGSFDKDDSEP